MQPRFLTRTSGIQAMGVSFQVQAGLGVFARVEANQVKRLSSRIATRRAEPSVLLLADLQLVDLLGTYFHGFGGVVAIVRLYDKSAPFLCLTAPLDKHAVSAIFR